MENHVVHAKSSVVHFGGKGGIWWCALGLGWIDDLQLDHLAISFFSNLKGFGAEQYGAEWMDKVSAGNSLIPDGRHWSIPGGRPPLNWIWTSFLWNLRSTQQNYPEFSLLPPATICHVLGMFRVFVRCYISRPHYYLLFLMYTVDCHCVNYKFCCFICQISCWAYHHVTPSHFCCTVGHGISLCVEIIFPGTISFGSPEYCSLPWVYKI